MSWQKVKVLTSLGKMHQRNALLGHARRDFFDPADCQVFKAPPAMRSRLRSLRLVGSMGCRSHRCPLLGGYDITWSKVKGHVAEIPLRGLNFKGNATPLSCPFFTATRRLGLDV